jgi:hypothetical protein
MYFQKFPKTFYSLDDIKTVQFVTNILTRVIVTEELQNNFSVYDEYDVTDSDTPENLAFQIYGDSQLHWIILHFNTILDARFDWPLSTNNLAKYVEGKYAKINGIHHYEDNDGLETNGNVVLNASTFNGINVADPIVNLTQNGVGFVTFKPQSTTLIVTTTNGGFQTGDQIALGTNNLITANITSTTTLSGTAVTNFVFEDRENEKKRRIRLLKPQFLERVIRDFESKMATIDG